MITISYCNSWGYKPRAVRAAAVLQQELGVTPELKVGPSGSFTVEVDGKVVAKKHMLGFPDEDEILEAVRKELATR